MRWRRRRQSRSRNWARLCPAECSVVRDEPSAGFLLTLIPYMMLAVAPRVLMTVRVCCANVQARMAGFRALSTSAVARKGMYSVRTDSPDIVQETYLRELKAYKAPEKAPDAHKGHVREFSSPAQPQAPSSPSSSDIASQLEAYTSSEPDVVEASVPQDVASEQQDVNEYLKELQADIKVEAHH